MKEKRLNVIEGIVTLIVVKRDEYKLRKGINRQT